MVTTDIYIFGASGHGKVVFDVAVSAGYNIKAFVDDHKSGQIVRGTKVISFIELAETKDICFALGIGDNSVRQKVFNRIKDVGGILPSLIHKSAIVSPDSQIDEGTVVMAGVIINSGAQIGKGVILNSGCIIEHDNMIGDYVHISPGASLAGNVSVGDFTHVGIGSNVRQGIVIGKRNIIGAGAALVCDFGDDNLIIGIPAKIKKR